MAQIKRMAVTGADNWVSYADINEVSREFPFAEWAMLLSPEELRRSDDQAVRRFPTANWLNGFFDNCASVRKTVHLCGGMLRQFVEGGEELSKVLARVDGIQLNFGFHDGGKFVLEDKAALDRLVGRVKASSNLEVILQYGGMYEGLAAAFKGMPNVSLLIDGSAGSGQLPDVWPANHPDFPTGFAGGLNPDIVTREINKICQVVPANYVITRVDAETGYRDVEKDAAGKVVRDEFSIPKVRQMGLNVRPFVGG